MAGTEPPLHAALARLLEALSESGQRGALIGGVAVGVRGTERFTADIDFTTTLDNESLEPFCEAAERRGIHPRRDDHLEFARRHRVLLLVDSETGTDIDLALAALPFELETIERAPSVGVGEIEVPVATAEDLVVMKMVAGRPQDLVDVATLLDANPGMDLARIRRHLSEFDDALDRPGLPADFERLLAESRTRSTQAE